MTGNRWRDFWASRAQDGTGADPQSQVLRTSGGRPIDPERWERTVADLASKLALDARDDLLDLGCGNGLLTLHFAPRCRSVTAVDVGGPWLDALARGAPANVRTVQADMRDVMFPEGAFSRILVYAAIQYLTEGETASLFRKMSGWLRSGGELFLGDVPDRDRMWRFYDTPERRATYFENCIANRDVVGTWYQAEWLRWLALDVGFRQFEIIAQPEEAIYAHFRFDARGRR